MHKEVVGDVYRIRFDSLDDMVEHASKHESTLESHEHDEEWTRVRTPAQAYSLARDGWPEELERALTAAQDTVTKVEREIALPTFMAEHDVAGCEVDVARYLDGTPENMIDYPLREIVRAGKVITLCASFAYSSAISAESVIKQGQAVTALALALSQLGYSIEIWSDWTTGDKKTGSERKIQIRTCVKGATDMLDPDRIMYALAHPSMLRILGFEIIRGEVPRGWRIYNEALGPIKPTVEDLPEGTIYLPPLKSNRDVPDADEQLIAWLRQLEIITD